MNILDKFDKRKIFKSRVLVILTGILSVLIIAIILRAVFFKQKEVAKEGVQQPEITIKPVSEVISEERMWRQSFQEKLDLEKDKLNSTIDNLKQDINKTDSTSLTAIDKISALEIKIAELNHELIALKTTGEEKPTGNLQQKVKQINQYTASLENSFLSPDYKQIKTPDNYIPSGGFAKGVLLSGVDASTSLSSQSDPDPVLIRITDSGTLPRRFKSDLKDCHIIGSAYGDLSSERAKIRLEKMSCTEITTAEIIETEVVGFVTGEDGRQGIRGSVVSTEGRLLGASLLSGILSGLSNNLAPQNRSISLFSDSNKTLSTSDKLQNSMTSGATSGLDRLSKYYIDRAESLQPIVQVGAGRKIDVIFTEGVFFGTSSVKKEIAKKREEKIRNASKD